MYPVRLFPHVASLLSSSSDAVPDHQLNHFLSSFDKHTLIRDLSAPEGVQYEHDLFAFAATSKGNNPDILSRRDMLAAEDRSQFLAAEPGEIAGLENYGVFEYHALTDVPAHRRRNLLNAIWSYRRKRRPDGTKD